MKTHEAHSYLTKNTLHVTQVNGEMYVDVGLPTGQIVAQIDPLHASKPNPFANCSRP